MPRIPSRAVLLIAIICLAHVASLPLPRHLKFAKGQDALAIEFETSSPPNFTMTITPASQTVRIGEVATYEIRLNSTNSFAGEVRLQTENFPPELLKAFTPTNLTLTANKLADSTLTINTISVGEEAFYQFTIIGISGSLTQKATISLTVLAEGAPLSTTSYAFLAAILLFAAFIVWYGLRARRLQQRAEIETSDEPKPPPV